MELPDGSLYIVYIATGGHTTENAKNNGIHCIRVRVRLTIPASIFCQRRIGKFKAETLKDLAFAHVGLCLSGDADLVHTHLSRESNVAGYFVKFRKETLCV